MPLHIIAVALRDVRFICFTKYDVGIEVEKDIQKEIEEIIAGLKCPKDFKCYKSGFKNLCRAKDIGVESFLECLEKKPKSCQFSVSFGLMHLCQCPLRVYIYKKLKK